jgi:hypothetical protein
MDHNLTIIILLLVVFLPSIIATTRRHRSRLAIDVLNVVAVGGTVLSLITALAMGLVVIPFTGIMWLIALVWSCTGDVDQKKLSGPNRPWHKKSDFEPKVDKRWANLRCLPSDK